MTAQCLSQNWQEYLAAQALAGWEDAKRTDLLLDAANNQPPALCRPEWRKTVLLLAGVLYRMTVCPFWGE